MKISWKFSRGKRKHPIQLKPLFVFVPLYYWRNLPKAAAIPELSRDALRRVEQMVNRPVSRPRTSASTQNQPAVAAAPEGRLEQAPAEAVDCRRCDLWKPATQIVFGEGPPDARVMMPWPGEPARSHLNRRSVGKIGRAHV